jgi:transcriptional regulator GlxA family with amidase domain
MDIPEHKKEECSRMFARQLLNAGDRNISVADVAVRTGFTHLSRFALSYRKLFGELPVVTLQRVTEPAAKHTR